MESPVSSLSRPAPALAQNVEQPVARERETAATIQPRRDAEVAVFTGGGDRPYALGLASALMSQNVTFDFIGSDEVDGPELHGNPLVNVLNLRGDQKRNVPRRRKVWRVLAYYARLLRYTVTAKPDVFHILWNNKIEYFDRTLLLLYYRCFGKRLVHTAHNVNAGQRDGTDSFLNRLTLRIQYHLVSNIFVHTEKMKRQLQDNFGVAEKNITIIPFGINSTVPNTSLTSNEAKALVGLPPGKKAILFYGNIAPYKGLEFLIDAFAEVIKDDADYRLLIVGKPKDCAEYWAKIRASIDRHQLLPYLIERIEYLPNEETENYFKAADVLVLPYTDIFQSGVLFLSFNFGLPVIASDVGSLKEDIISGRTGFICQPRNPLDLALKLREYFQSNLYFNLNAARKDIQALTHEGHSWTRVGEITASVYAGLHRKK